MEALQGQKLGQGVEQGQDGQKEEPEQRTESRCQLFDRMRLCMPPRLAASPSSRLKIFARGACGWATHCVSLTPASPAARDGQTDSSAAGCQSTAQATKTPVSCHAQTKGSQLQSMHNDTSANLASGARRRTSW